jgi:hypothetical protein
MNGRDRPPERLPRLKLGIRATMNPDLVVGFPTSFFFGLGGVYCSCILCPLQGPPSKFTIRHPRGVGRSAQN